VSEPHFSIGLYGANGKALTRLKPIPVKVTSIEVIDGRVALCLGDVAWNIGYFGALPVGHIIYLDGKEYARREFPSYVLIKRGSFLRATGATIFLAKPGSGGCPLGGKWDEAGKP
jgi:hypothetical protein